MGRKGGREKEVRVWEGQREKEEEAKRGGK